MAQYDDVVRRQVDVSNVLGLHLRVADKIVKLASTFQSDIQVQCRGVIANARSILDLLSLAAECGTMLALEAQGCDAEDAVAALASLISAQAHEPQDQYEQATGSSPIPPASMSTSPQLPGRSGDGASWKSSPTWDSSRRVPRLESGTEGRSTVRGRWYQQRSRHES